MADNISGSDIIRVAKAIEQLTKAIEAYNKLKIAIYKDQKRTRARYFKD